MTMLKSSHPVNLELVRPGIRDFAAANGGTGMRRFGLLTGLCRRVRPRGGHASGLLVEHDGYSTFAAIQCHGFGGKAGTPDFDDLRGRFRNVHEDWALAE